MELKELRSGWTLSFQNSRVQLIQIDFRLSLLITGDFGQVWLHVETAGQLTSGGVDFSLSPRQSTTLAPVLALFNTSVDQIRVTRTGLLVVDFGRDRVMHVSPHHEFEAWQIECTSGKGDWMLVCPPGGDVAFFQDLDGVRHRRPMN